MIQCTFPLHINWQIHVSTVWFARVTVVLLPLACEDGTQALLWWQIRGGRIIFQSPKNMLHYILVDGGLVIITFCRTNEHQRQWCHLMSEKGIKVQRCRRLAATGCAFWLAICALSYDPQWQVVVWINTTCCLTLRPPFSMYHLVHSYLLLMIPVVVK